MAKTLDRERLRKLLGMLGSTHDGEVLNAARLIDGMIRDSGTAWTALIDDDASAQAGSDLARLDQLLASAGVSDVLKLRLRDMRRAARAGRLSEADRRMLQLFYRKAVLDGAVVEL